MYDNLCHERKIAMFCPKCGTKAIEGADFCQKCGAKLIKDAPITQVSAAPPSPDKDSIKSIVPEQKTQKSFAQKATIPEAEKDGGIADLLSERITNCPAIKSVKQTKNGIAIKGRIYNHIVAVVNGQARIGSVLTFPFSILYALPAGLLCYVVSNIAWSFADYGTIYFEDHCIPIAFSFLLAGLAVIVHTLVGRKEKADIAAYAREVLEPNGIRVTPSTSSGGISKKGLSMSIALILAGIVILIIPLLGDMDFSNDANTPNEIEGLHTPDIESEEVLLTQTYANTAEGISFMYPDDWFVSTDTSDMLITITNGSSLGIRATISVSKSSNGEVSLSGTKDDFEAAYADNGFSNVEVIDLADMELSGHFTRKVTMQCTNTDGIRFVSVQYFYALHSEIYVVSCIVIEEYFDQYEPILEAIMGSYTITATDSAPAFPLMVSSDAKNLFEQWVTDHPLHFDYYMDLTSDDWRDADGNSSFLFGIVSGDTDVFSVSVRKSDGYMQFINHYGTMSLDDWYEEWYGEGNVNQGGVLLHGIPLNEVIGMQSNDIIENFGESYNWGNDCIQYGIHDIVESTIYDDGWVEFNLYGDGGYVSSFSTDPRNLTFNDQSLAQDMDTLVTILGDNYINQSSTTYSWSVAWYYEDYEISFEFLTNTEEINSNIPYSAFVCKW